MQRDIWENLKGRYEGYPLSHLFLYMSETLKNKREFEKHIVTILDSL